MRYMTVSTSSVTQELVPALAGALDHLRRSPGTNEAWVEAALRALERGYPATHERLRRRLGLAHRLADLANLGREEQAKMSLGLFFHELISDEVPKATSKRSRTWIHYLLGNFDRLAPSLQISQALRLPSWEDIDRKEAAVAKVAIVLDSETVEHNAKPLEIIQSLQADALTPAAEEIVALLLSEHGQELCDNHFRLRGQGYTLEGAEIRKSLELLKPPPTSPPLEAPDTPLAETEATSSQNFEQRRQALRSGPDWTSLRNIASEETRPEEEAEPEQRTGTTSATPGPPEAEPANDRQPAPNTPSPEAEQPSTAAPQPREEKDMAIPQIPSTPSSQPHEQQMAERFRELRSQLEQIQQVAVEGQQLLDSLAPELEEFTAWLDEIETIVGRWKGRGRSQEEAA